MNALFNLEFHLQLVGVLLIMLYVLNLIVPRHFGWKEELKKVSLLTRRVFFVHCFFIAFVVLGLGLLSLFFTTTLTDPSQLATLVLGFFAVFWAIRLYMQWFVYDRSLWRGQRFNTAMHFTFSFTWLYMAAVYTWAFVQQLQFRA